MVNTQGLRQKIECALAVANIEQCRRSSGHLTNSIHNQPVLYSFRSMSHDYPVTVEPFQFSSRQGGVAYEGSYVGGRPNKIAPSEIAGGDSDN